MSDDNQAEGEKKSSGGAISEFFENGGILQVALGKAASKAISRLIGGAADIPAAGLENIAQRIRDNTKARSKMTDAIATAASKKASKDPRIIGRAIERWASVEVRKQKNREEIAEKTIEDLKHEPPTDSTSDGPSDDFMSLFESLAENASSEKLQDLFARVLAGEIRKAGTFSLRTIQVISVMDQRLAEAVSSLRKWSSGSTIVLYEGFRSGPKLDTLMFLADYSLVRIGSFNKKHNLRNGQQLMVPFASKSVVVSNNSSKPDEHMQIDLSVYVLTPVGLELMSLLPPDEDLEVIQGIANYLATRYGYGSGKVEIADVMHLGDSQISILNSVSVSDPSMGV